MSKNIPLIVWSGGYDSTALLLDAYHRGERFDLLSVNLLNNDYKIICEAKARKKILSILKPGPLLRKHYTWDCGLITNPGDWLLTQPLIWLTAIMMFLRREHHEIRLGYYKGNCPFNATESFFNTFSNMFKLCQFDFKRPEILAPFINIDKEQIFKDWYFNDDFLLGKKVYPHAWTCEQPKKKGRGYIECGGYCTPCKSKLRTLCLIENFHLNKGEITCLT